MQPPHPTCEEEEIGWILHIIKCEKLDKFVIELVWNEIQKDIVHKIVPTFWTAFVDKPSDERQGFERLCRAVGTLYNSLAVYKDTLEMLKRIDNVDVDSQFKTAVQGIMLAKIPTDHQVLLGHFFSLSFKVFCNADNNIGKLAREK